MGTKNNPGDYDCYANAEPDEPMFVLLARDPVAPVLVMLWTQIRSELSKMSARGDEPEKLEEAEACADAMKAYYRAKRGSVLTGQLAQAVEKVLARRVVVL